MDSAKLNEWMQVIGIFAVVASLVFVGLQMKQSQEIAIAAQYQERYSTAMEYWIGRSSDEYDMRIVGERLLGRHGSLDGELKDLSMEELGRQYSVARQTLLMYDNYHFQYSAGFLTAEAWETYKRQLAAAVRVPSIRWVLHNNESGFRPSFIEQINRITADSE